MAPVRPLPLWEPYFEHHAVAAYGPSPTEVRSPNPILRYLLVGSDVKEGYIAALCFVFSFKLGFSRLVFACFEYLEILILESFTPWNPSKRLEPQESWRWMLQMTSFFKHFLLLSDFSW